MSRNRHAWCCQIHPHYTSVQREHSLQHHKGPLAEHAQALVRAGFTEVQPKQTDPIFAETRFLYLRHPHGKEPLTIKVHPHTVI